jgi:tRNA pseudouridine55 synthase
MNGIIIIDKPSDWTSHDVVAKLRGILGERRIGHGGTLDPMATGVLPIFVGRATRAIELLPTGKTYLAKMKLGVVTDTQDTTGNIISINEDIPEYLQIAKAAEAFTGQGFQIPPMVSAIKINGQRLYNLARKGVEVERKPRPVTFSKIDVSPCEDSTEIELLVECSGGAYIRTLCHDIGAKLGCGAAMSGLKRLKSGPFDISKAVTLGEVSRDDILPVDLLFIEYPAYTAAEAQEKNIRNGAVFSVDMPDGHYRVYAQNGEFLALAEVSQMRMSSIKSFYSVSS